MGFKFKCADIGMACGFETNANTKEQLMTQIATHAKQAHNMATIRTDVLTKVQAAIKPIYRALLSDLRFSCAPLDLSHARRDSWGSLVCKD